MDESKPPFAGRDFAREDRAATRKALEPHATPEQLAQFDAVANLEIEHRTVAPRVFARDQVERLVPRGHVFPGLESAGELISGDEAAGAYFRILSGGDSLWRWSARLSKYRRNERSWTDHEGDPAHEPLATLLCLTWAALDWLRDGPIRHYHRPAGTLVTPQPWTTFDHVAIDAFERSQFDRTQAVAGAYGLWCLLSLDHPVVRHGDHAFELFSVRSDVVLAAPEMLDRAVKLHGKEVLARLGVEVKAQHDQGDKPHAEVAARHPEGRGTDRSMRSGGSATPSERAQRDTPTRRRRTTADKDGCFAAMRKKLKRNAFETQAELRTAIDAYFVDFDDRPSTRTIQVWAKQLWAEHK